MSEVLEALEKQLGVTSVEQVHRLASLVDDYNKSQGKTRSFEDSNSRKLQDMQKQFDKLSSEIAKQNKMAAKNNYRERVLDLLKDATDLKYVSSFNDKENILDHFVMLKEKHPNKTDADILSAIDKELETVYSKFSSMSEKEVKSHNDEKTKMEADSISKSEDEEERPMISDEEALEYSKPDIQPAKFGSAAIVADAMAKSLKSAGIKTD